MTKKSIKNRDIEKTYKVSENVEKLERLIACLKNGEPFEIQVQGERIYVPADAVFSIEHERDGKSEELEFQFKWKRK